VAAALALTACAGDVDDVTGSRLTQPPVGTPPPKPTPAGDITIVGQEVGHAIMELPEVANATTPPLVQFTGVTSIIVSPVPIDTEPYTDLLRDRILLITRLKLRFIEHTLPPLVVSSKKGKKSAEAAPVQNTSNPDFQILAELRGRYDAELYKIQVEFVDAHTREVLFNGLYSIRKEGSPDAPSAIEQANSPTGDTMAPPQPTNLESTAPEKAPATSSPSTGQAPADPFHQANPNPAGIQ